MSLVATLLNQRSAQLNKVKERNIRSICIQQLFRSLRAHQYSSDQKKILKDQIAQTTARVVSVAYHLWLPFLINRVLSLTKYIYIYTYLHLFIYITYIYKTIKREPEFINLFEKVQVN